ncbi:MAG: glycosyltransferase family 2 protein [Sediminibacterium sp.]
METFFWISILVIFYTYIGYGALLYGITRVMRMTGSSSSKTCDVYELPAATVVVAAYNEAYCIKEKIENTLSLMYPAEKISYLFVTDGSTDETAAIVGMYPQITLLHSTIRSGKAAAINRAMQQVVTPVVFFTDANTILNEDALQLMAHHYRDGKTGAVAGEKRVQITEVTDATVGEGVYWQYESRLRKWDAALNSVIGAAGELFSIRTALYDPLPADTISDDFMISMRIVQKGYRIAYEPGAYTTEQTSADMKEELKRKIRIASGSIQAMIRLKALLLPFHQPLLSFQYFSHRVLRWAVTPFAIPAALVLNIFLVIQGNRLYLEILLVLQSVFYLSALLGWIFDRIRWKTRLFFLPFYVCLVNYAAIIGAYRHFFGKQTVLWEKSKRK